MTDNLSRSRLSPSQRRHVFTAGRPMHFHQVASSKRYAMSSEQDTVTGFSAAFPSGPLSPTDAASEWGFYQHDGPQPSNREMTGRRRTLCGCGKKSRSLNTPEKTLSKQSLRFLELLRDMPGIGELVKEVYISPMFNQSSTLFVITASPAWQLLAEINGYLPNVEWVSLSFHCYPEIDEPMMLDNELAEALPMILPSCPFRKLTIENVSIQPTYLMELLAHLPQITSLDISEATLAVWAGPEPQHAMVKDTHPKINELILSEANFIFQVCWENNPFRTVIAPSTVRRLVLPLLDTTGLGTLALWTILGQLMPRLTSLKEVFLQLSHMCDPDPHVLVHAPSLCLGIGDAANLVSCARALTRAAADLPDSDVKLQRLAIVVHRGRRGDLWNSDVWRELASALRQLHLSRLKTVCINFHEWDYLDYEREGMLPYEEVSSYFKDCRVKVTVRKKTPIPGGLYSYFDTMF